MATYSFDQNSSLGQGFHKLYDPFLVGLNGANLYGDPVPPSLVLDSERGELVKAPAKVGKNKELSEAKARTALRNHSEAEKRRRERINSHHLDTLRGLVPSNGKMDKATLLAQVISQVKELKKNAMEASKGYLIPMDGDEVKVEPYYQDEAGSEDFLYKASICFEYRPELMSELRQALDALPLKIINAEISTLGGRLKNAFVFTCCKKGNIDNAEAPQCLANSVLRALNSVLAKTCPSPEHSPRTTFGNKRQRISCFDSPCSAS